MPCRQINSAMKTLSGLDFIPASTPEFEKRTRANATAIHSDLIDKMRPPIKQDDPKHCLDSLPRPFDAET